MDCMIWIIAGLAVGLIFGYLVGKHYKKVPVGTLRVDRSDPTEAPYLFLEIEHGGVERIEREKEVLFRVDLNSYLPRK